MPHGSRPYPLVPMPQGNGLQTLSGLMSLVGGVQELRANRMALEDQTAKRASRVAVEDAFKESQGSLTGAIAVLERQQRWPEVQALKTNEATIRAKALDSFSQRLQTVKSSAGQGAELLRQVEATPALYPQIRPTLLDLASRIDPRLTTEIPEQYEPAKVRGMVQFVNEAATLAEGRARAVEAAKAKLTAKGDLVKQGELDRTLVSQLFSTSPNQTDWDSAHVLAADYGVDAALLKQVGPTWSADAVEQARQVGLTAEQRKPKAPSDQFAGAILDAYRRKRAGTGTQSEINELVALQQRSREGGGGPLNTQAAVQTILKNPSIWADINPSVRDQVFVALGQAGFNFGAASQTQKGQIERWRMDAISALKKQRDDPDSAMNPSEPGSQALYQAEADRIEQSYRVQMGETAPSPTRQPTALPSSRIQQQRERRRGTARPASADVTALNPSEEGRFQRWVAANRIEGLDEPDTAYDYRGYWKEYGDTPIRFGIDHFPDTYKQHGHPTFSVESKYSTGPQDGGHWEKAHPGERGDPAGEIFVPGPTSNIAAAERAGAVVRRRQPTDQRPRTPSATATYAAGDTVLYQGRKYRIEAVLPDGKYRLDPTPLP